MEKTSSRRLLIVRNDGIGDLVLTLPAMAALRRSFPSSHISLLAGEYAAPLVTRLEHVDRVMTDHPEDAPLALAARLRRERFDAALVINTNWRNALATRLAGIPRRVTWSGKPAGWLGNCFVRVRRSHPPIHESQFALEFVKALAPAAQVPGDGAGLEIDLVTRRRVAAEIQRRLGSTGPLFGVHPENRGSAYNWPLARYAELASRLSWCGRVMITGSRADRPQLAALEALLSGAVRQRIAIFDDLRLDELAAAIALQDVLAVSSTGPMHIAGAVGTATVSLFSPHPAHSPAKWAPLGGGHTILVAPLAPGEDARVTAERAAAVMDRISVDAVLEAGLSKISSVLAAA